jgi:hypothetical protein
MEAFEMSEITRGDDRRSFRPVLARCWWLLWEWLAGPLHYRAVRRLYAAAESGDRDRLQALVAPDVSVVVDSGSGEPSGVRVVRGFEDAQFVLEHGFARRADDLVEERSVNGQAGLIISRAGIPTACIAVDFTGRLVTVIWIRLEPAALRHWNTVHA